MLRFPVTGRRACAVLFASFVVAVTLVAAPPQPAVDAAFTRFWNASSPREAERTVAAILATDVSFDTAYARLRNGRPYRSDVQTGVISTQRDGRFPYTLQVPDTYSPDRKYRVRVQLHGGVNRPAPVRNDQGIGRMAGGDQIYILPAAWRGAMWWTRAQVDNLRAIVDNVKRTYNVDENLIALAGVSDGGTGAYFMAMRDPQLYSSILPMIGYAMVLENPAVEVEGELYPTNFRNRPFFIVNSGKDRLYPTSLVEPSIKHFASYGVDMTYRPQPEAGHDTTWWPTVKDEFESFITSHARNPLPDQLTWETSDLRNAGRLHWLVIDELGATASDATDMVDLNQFTYERGSEAGRTVRLFSQSKPSGRVDLTRTGNRVDITSRGVKTLTLLVSPDQFNLAEPLTVIVNGEAAFRGRVTPSLATLLKWAARDNDRTMLFGAEIQIQVK